MNSPRAYLDYNASAPLRPEARAAMLAALDRVGNASSVHAEGRWARDTVEKAREQVASSVGARPREIIFTSGGTEANCWVLAGGWERVVTSATEHESVLAPARRMAPEAVELVTPTASGTLDPDRLTQALGGKPARGLLSVQMANNETGVRQDIETLTRVATDHGWAVHTDAVQAFGKVPITFEALGVTYLSLSAHKIGGPKGVGALVVTSTALLAPLIVGGGQESRRRAGTENVAGIAGFGAAAEASARDPADMDHLADLRDGLERGVKRITPDAVVVGERSRRLPNTSCIALPGRRAENLVISLDLEGVAVSAGAACSSGKVARSHVLDAMGLGEDLASSAIRVSLGWATTEADIETFLRAWSTVAARSAARRAVA